MKHITAVNKNKDTFFSFILLRRWQLAVTGIFVASKRRSDPTRSRFLTLKKLSMMYLYFTITFFISLLPSHSIEM